MSGELRHREGDLLKVSEEVDFSTKFEPRPSHASTSLDHSDFGDWEQVV